VKQLFDSEEISYPEMNRLAAEAPIGSGGLTILPFGNGAERMLNNQEPGSSIQHLNFNMHDRTHLMRAVQEGIVFSFRYGMEIMEQMGIQPKVIRAGYTNMFQSDVFRESLATSLNANIELFNTDGSAGAARGAALGTGELSVEDIFHGLARLEEVLPDEKNKQQYDDAYHRWKKDLELHLK
jgi:xylulokinase